MTIERKARAEAERRAWDGELSHTDREAFERGYIAGALSQARTAEEIAALRLFKGGQK